MPPFAQIKVNDYLQPQSLSVNSERSGGKNSSTFDKKVILFGSEGNAKVFASKYKQDAFDPQLWKKTNMPSAVIEVVDPIALGAKVVDVNEGCCCDDDFDIASVPESVCRVFDDSLILGGEQKRVYVSIGIFSIIKLERRVQLLIPAYDYCIPQKECIGATDDNPCDLFERICLSADEAAQARTFRNFR